MRHPVVRQWWKENEQFFKTGDYKSVKPGEEMMGKLDEEARQHEEWARARDAKVAAEREASAVSAATATRTVPTADGWGAFGYGLVGLLVLLLVAGVTLYGRSARHV